MKTLAKIVVGYWVIYFVTTMSIFALTEYPYSKIITYGWVLGLVVTAELFIVGLIKYEL